MKKKLLSKLQIPTIFICLVGLILVFPNQGTAQTTQGTTSIDIDLGQSVGDMYPMWAYVGYDEGNYTYLADGKKLLTELSELSSGPVYIRAHNLLNTHEGSPIALKWGSTDAYTEDEDGNPVYNWEVVDKIVDTWIERGMKPLMEIGFMPKALSTNPEPYRHNWTPGDPYRDIWTGWAYPPNDYEKWGELVYQWVRHSVERYGKEEVESWWWQVWNEPDAGYWAGTDEEFFKLHDYTADAVKRALPTARIGGPHVTGAYGDRQGQFFKDFLEHCRSGTNYVTGETGSPLDFIGFHAKGSPQVTEDGHVRMRMSYQLRQIDAAFNIVDSFPEFRDLPVIIGESDPEGCAACGLVFGYPEMGYRNGTVFSSYLASSFAKKYELADQYGTNFEGAMSWTFTFPDQPWFSGFRSFSTNGVDKPLLNVLRMFGMMEGDRVAVSTENSYSAQRVIEEGVVGEPDINALASIEDGKASVMVWNYHDDDVAGPTSKISLNLSDIPADRVLMHHYRIDNEHSNSFTTWQEMGAPQQVTHQQYKTLEQSGQLELLTSPEWMDISSGQTTVEFELPRHGVSFLQLTW